MNAQQLKNSILQMAVSGKLVPQDPNDEPASVLLERIRAEKEELIRSGKIKREKNPSTIFRGPDGAFYEKIGSRDPMNITGDLPFDIPDSWEWVRLGEVGDWGSGATPSRSHPEYYGGNIPWLKTGDLNDSYIYSVPEYITDKAIQETSVRLNPVGSVLIAMYGATIGKLGIAKIPLTTNQACCACLPLGKFYNRYLFYFLMYQKPFFIKQGEGGAQPNISKEKIIATIMPIPPLEEQYRIVEKIEDILPIVYDYEKKDEYLTELNTQFPGKLKKSILQQAVQGKLVPQDPTEEPASVLLERIRAEKERLIAEGKIKRDKNESVIYKRDNSYFEKINNTERCIDDELPFDIPDSWEWVRLGNIGDWGSGATPSRSHPEYYEGNIPWLKTGDLNDGYIYSVPEFITDKALQVTSVRLNPIGSVLIAMYGATIGKLGIAKIPLTTNQACCACFPLGKLYNKYLFYFLMYQKPFFIKQGEGGAQPNISKEKIIATIMPVPPLSEQQRIVEKIEALMPMINAL